MGKSQQYRWFAIAEGKRARFNQIAFLTAVQQHAKEYERNNQIKRGGNAAVFKMIYQELYQQPGIEPSGDQIQAIKNWFYGYNGPAYLEDIYKLAEILECERKDQFLIYEREKEHEQMNSVQETGSKFFYITETPAMAQERRMLIEVLNTVKEKEVAHELYSVFVDAISKYNVEEENAFINSAPRTAESVEAIRNHPKRYPLIIAIRKAAIYLPKELLDEAYALVEYMYGVDYAYEWHEPNPECLIDGFTRNRYSQLHEYLNKCKTEYNLSNEDERIDAWVDFLSDQSYHLYDMLDDIFCDYIRD